MPQKILTTFSNETRSYKFKGYWKVEFIGLSSLFVGKFFINQPEFLDFHSYRRYAKNKTWQAVPSASLLVPLLVI